MTEDLKEFPISQTDKTLHDAIFKLLPKFPDNEQCALSITMTFN